MNITSINSSIYPTVFKNIENNEIESEQTEKIKIAMIAAAEDIESLCENIENYGIDPGTEEGQKALEEIAEIAAHKNGKSISRNIEKFGIKSEEVRIRIAKIAAANNGYGMSQLIKNYGIDSGTKEGQEGLIEIAKIAAAYNGEDTTEYIKIYGIDANTKEGQEALIEIAKIAAAQDGRGTSKNIKNYGIKSEKALIEIAMIAAANSGDGTSEFIKEYGIDSKTERGQKALIEILKVAVANNKLEVPSYIKNYEIDSHIEEGLKVLVKIAKMALANDENGTSQDIKNYGIDANTKEGQEGLIEIAKIAAAYNGEKTSEFIKNYGIDANTKEGQEALIEMAEIAAANSGYGVSKFIKEYGIKSEKALVKIAKIAAASNGYGTSKFIKNYGIKSEKVLVKIAKITAANSGGGTSERIKNYGIDSNTVEGLKALIEIAKIAAANSGSETSENIKNYEIDSSTEEGQKALIEIAKIAAANDGYGTSQGINNYEINPNTKEGKKALIEIAEIAITNIVLRTPEFIIKNYGIDFNTEDGKKTFEKIAKTTLKQAILQLQTFTINELKLFSESLKIFFDMNKESHFLKLFENNLSPDQTFDNFKQLCKQQLSINPASTFTAWLNESYTSIKNDHDKQKFLEWITVLTVFSSVSGKCDLVMQNMDLLNSIRKTPPWLRNLLTKELLGFYIDFSEEKNNLLQIFRDKCTVVKNEKGEIIKKLKTPPIHTELVSLIFAGYPSESQDACLDAIEKIKGERDFFRRENNKKILLETLTRIKNCPITPDSKKCVIEQLFHLDGAKRLDACKLARNLINFKEFTHLQCLEKKKPTEKGLIKDLENSLGNFFKKTFQTRVENFGEKYAQTFETWRGIDSLITFAGKMNSLVGPEKDEPLKLLSEVVTNVLNDDFQTKRYETDNNPHMDFLKNDFPEVFEKWKNNLSLDRSEVVTVNKKEKISIPNAIKKQILTGLRNQHLGGKLLFPHIEQFINNSSKLNFLESIEKELKSLNEKRKASDDGKFSKEDIELRKRLLIEKNVLELFTIDHEDSLKEKLKSLINKLPRNNVFRQTDLETCLKLFANEISEVIGFKVIESDHPNNLLLMGTEVDGSCQSVNGSPGLNKCLLSYIVDSKNKLPLIVDAQGKILARAIVRILFDKNNKPVLFLEDMYTSGSNPLYAPNLRKLALKKARDLGIPLVALDQNKGEHSRPFDSAVFAKEKPVTFEYVDALKGIEEGSYLIPYVYEVIEKT